MAGLAICLAYFVYTTALGTFAFALAARRTGPLAAEFWLPLGFGIGLGIQGLAVMTSLALFHAVVPGTLWLLLAALPAAAAAALWKDMGDLGRFGGFQFLRDVPAPARGLSWGCVLLIVLLLGALYANAGSYPFTSYDGRTIWTFKTRILLEEQTVYTDAFLHPLRVHYHREYPILVPTVQYILSTALGELNERRIRSLFSTFFLFQVLFFYGVLRRLGGSPVLAVLVALLYCATPFRDDWAERDGGALNSGAVDIPLSFFAMVSITSYLLWFRGGGRWLWGVGVFFGAMCLLTKSEGIVILAVTTGANVLQLLLGGGDRTREKVAMTLAAPLATALVALPWLVLSRDMPIVYDEDYAAQLRWEVLSRAPERLPLIVSDFWDEIVNLQKWNAFWLAGLATVVAAVPTWHRRRDFYLDAVIVAWLAAYVFVYMVSPLNLIYHLNTSISRLMSHILPVVLLRVALFWADRSPLRAAGGVAA